MGRPGITRIDVVRAYIALLKQGRNPGLRNLRLQLGRGSYATISAHLRWLAVRDARRLKSVPRLLNRLVPDTRQEVR